MKKIAFLLFMMWSGVAMADHNDSNEINGPSTLTSGVPQPEGMQLVASDINTTQGAWDFTFDGDAKDTIEEFARELRAKGWNIEYVSGNQDLWGGAGQLEANDGHRYLQMVIKGVEDHHQAQMKIYEDRPAEVEIRY